MQNSFFLSAVKFTICGLRPFYRKYLEISIFHSDLIMLNLIDIRICTDLDQRKACISTVILMINMSVCVIDTHSRLDLQLKHAFSQDRPFLALKGTHAHARARAGAEKRMELFWGC